MFPTVTISSRGEARLRGGHPWIYRADVGDVQAAGGDRVAVRSARGQILGHAFYSDRSQIALRMLTRGEEPADDGLIRRRIEAALAFRGTLAIDGSACRLVHGEADLLPSLIVDRYGDYLVVQTLSQGADRLLPLFVSTLQELAGPAGILARNDPRTRALEGLEQKVEVLAGEVPDTIAVTENGVRYDVDVRRGQKTGLFLDQRENRSAAALVCARTAAGLLHVQRRVRAGPREPVRRDDRDRCVRGRDRPRARRTPPPTAWRSTRASGNVFDELRGLDRLGERFDTIVLDPPAFAKNKAAVTNARAGYKEINLRAFKLLNHGGTLVTCSCSYNVNEGMFGEIVYEAAARRLGQRHGRREADAGARSPGAARGSRNLLPEMFHPQKTVAAAAAEAKRAVRRLARPAGEFDASRYFRGEHNLGFYNTGTGPLRALARAIHAAQPSSWTVGDAMAFADALMPDRYLEVKAVGIEWWRGIAATSRRRCWPRWKRWLAAQPLRQLGDDRHDLRHADRPAAGGRIRSSSRGCARGRRHRNMWVRRASIVGLLPLDAQGGQAWISSTKSRSGCTRTNGGSDPEGGRLGASRGGQGRRGAPRTVSARQCRHHPAHDVPLRHRKVHGRRAPERLMRLRPRPPTPVPQPPGPVLDIVAP